MSFHNSRFVVWFSQVFYSEIWSKFNCEILPWNFRIPGNVFFIDLTPGLSPVSLRSLVGKMVWISSFLVPAGWFAVGIYSDVGKHNCDFWWMRFCITLFPIPETGINHLFRFQVLNVFFWTTSAFYSSIYPANCSSFPIFIVTSPFCFGNASLHMNFLI